MQEMQHFDDHVIRDLEFDLVRLMLHDFCMGDTARLRTVDLTPMCEKKQVVRALNEANELKRIRTEEHGFPALEFKEMAGEIRTLRIADAVLPEESFKVLVDASVLVNAMLVFFDKREEDFPYLVEHYAQVYHTTEITEAIHQVFDVRGKVRDDASPELYKIRQDMASVRRKINRNFTKVLKEFGDKGWLADTREGYVSERRVLAIMSTHKRKVSGATLGSSKTGTITFVEPEANVPLSYELESLRDDEQREIFRILKALTNKIRKFLPLIEGWQALLTEIDFINARTRLALEMNASMPGVSDEQEIDLIRAFHPILWLSNDKQGIKTHPQSLRLDKFSRMLVISGPNAGGKSVTLKTVGLLQVMFQSGLLIPADSSSQMSIFHTVLTDIGDNQSIENQLSTYSYRLRRMRHFLEVANRRSLLLLDEFGTGSDPDLGGALAEVFFEELYKRKSFGVITTHYANIKLKAAELQNAINGCMLFDTESLAPLYKLDVGQPGSSFTFEVASINGISPDLIEAAKNRLDTNKVKLDALIADLQKEKSNYGGLNDRALKAELEAQKAKHRFESQQAKLEEKIVSQQTLIESNNLNLNRGKRLSTYIDRYDLRPKSASNKELLEDIRKYLAVEKTRIEEAKKAEELRIKAEAKKSPKKKIKPNQELIVVGSTVRLNAGGKQRGKVLEIDGERVIVAFGVFKTKVELAQLVFIQ
jgi:DNA mismatch repair protein MutS2